MKKQNFLIFVLLSVLVILMGCKDDDLKKPDYSVPASNEIVFSCTSNWGDDNMIIWKAESEIGLFCQQINATNSCVGVAAPSIGETLGLFYMKQQWQKEDHQFHIYMPYNENYNSTLIAGILSDVQVQNGETTTHIQEHNFACATLNCSPSETAIDVELKSIFGFMDFALQTVKYRGWNVKSITISTTESIALAGNYSFDLKNGKLQITKPSSSLMLRVSSAPDLAQNIFHGFAVIHSAPLKGKKCTVEIVIQKAEEDDLILESEITISENIIAEKLTTLSINLDEMDEHIGVDESVDLSEKAGTANCYIANTPGQTYRFPATVMGNGYTTPATVNYPGNPGTANGINPLPLEPQSAQLLWQTEKGLITDVKLKKGYVYFTVNGSETTPLKEGNASIAIYSGKAESSSILWSWHIWVTSADLEIDTQIYTIHPDFHSFSEYLAPIFMDRNLGACGSGLWLDEKNSSHGLKYQWGRKDPFLGADNSNLNSIKPVITYDKNNELIPSMQSGTSLSSTTVWYAVTGSGVVGQLTLDEMRQYPMNFITGNNWLNTQIDDLWGNPHYEVESNKIGHKSIYDPCPPGWRVPHRYAWSGFTDLVMGGNKTTRDKWHVTDNTEAGMKANGGYRFLYDGSKPTSYPATGMINNTNGQLFRVGNYAGCYWSSAPFSINDNRAAAFYFDYGNVNTPKNIYRAYGYNVRCMRER